MTTRTSTQMAQEIAEQPAAVRRTLAALLPCRPALEERFEGRRRVLFAARGSSDNAAVYGRYLLETHAGVPGGTSVRIEDAGARRGGEQQDGWGGVGPVDGSGDPAAVGRCHDSVWCCDDSVWCCCDSVWCCHDWRGGVRDGWVRRGHATTVAPCR